jgi:hypothetical protein
MHYFSCFLSFYKIRIYSKNLPKKDRLALILGFCSFCLEQMKFPFFIVSTENLINLLFPLPSQSFCFILRTVSSANGGGGGSVQYAMEIRKKAETSSTFTSCSYAFSTFTQFVFFFPSHHFFLPIQSIKLACTANLQI